MGISSRNSIKNRIIVFLEFLALVATIIAAIPLVEKYLLKSDTKLEVFLSPQPLDGYSFIKDNYDRDVYFDGLNFMLRVSSKNKNSLTIEEISLIINKQGRCNILNKQIDTSKIQGAGSSEHGNIKVAIMNHGVKTLFRYKDIKTVSNGKTIYSALTSKSTIFVGEDNNFIDFVGSILLRSNGLYKINFAFQYSQENDFRQHTIMGKDLYVCKEDN